MSTDVLLVDDELHLRTATAQGLELAGLSVEHHADGRDALTGLSR